MRTVKLPESSKDFIDISNIHDSIAGIIIAYKEDIPVGYINYDSDVMEWGFSRSIDCYDTDCSEKALSTLIRYIINAKIASNFKLIDFGKKNEIN